MAERNLDLGRINLRGNPRAQSAFQLQAAERARRLSELTAQGVLPLPGGRNISELEVLQDMNRTWPQIGSGKPLFGPGQDDAFLETLFGAFMDQFGLEPSWRPRAPVPVSPRLRMGGRGLRRLQQGTSEPSPRFRMLRERRQTEEAQGLHRR